MCESLISKIIELRDEINDLSLRMGKDGPIFRSFQTPTLSYTCSEAGFIKIVSWLYSLYYESGKISLDFLLDKLNFYGLDQERVCPNNKTIIHSLRTILQHSLDPNKDNDNFIQQNCTKWIEECCKVTFPNTDKHWSICLKKITDESLYLLIRIKECLLRIEKDDLCDQIIRDLNFKCSHYHSIQEYERLVSEVSIDIGLDYINPRKICALYYDQWIKELENLQGNYIFEIEAKKRIERDLLKNPIIPISASDIMREFDLGPGPKVGELLRKAISLYQVKPCKSDELLLRLKGTVLEGDLK